MGQLFLGHAENCVCDLDLAGMYQCFTVEAQYFCPITGSSEARYIRQVRVDAIQYINTVSPRRQHTAGKCCPQAILIAIRRDSQGFCQVAGTHDQNHQTGVSSRYGVNIDHCQRRFSHRPYFQLFRRTIDCQQIDDLI